MRAKLVSSKKLWAPNLLTVKNVVIGWWPSLGFWQSYKNTLVDIIFGSIVHIPNLSLLPCREVAYKIFGQTHTRNTQTIRTNKTTCWCCSAPQKFWVLKWPLLIILAISQQPTRPRVAEILQGLWAFIIKLHRRY